MVASDAFFPFPDGPETAMRRRGDGADPARRIEARPEVIAACDAAGAAMVFTGRRHFRH